MQDLLSVANNNRKTSGSSELGLEAPSGFEPLHRSFADCSLSHLGTAPREKGIIVRGWAGRLVEKGERRSPPIGQDRNLFPGCRGLIGLRFELFPSIV